MLDIVPAQLRVKVIRRPALRLPGLRGGGGAGAGAGAADHRRDGDRGAARAGAGGQVCRLSAALPPGADLRPARASSSTARRLCDWVGRACWWLEPLWRLLRRHVMSSTRIFADDTPLPVLDPGRGRTKTGRLWGYAVDDRPWNGSTPPAVVYLYAEDRKGEHPAAHLAEFQGILQVDGYGGFKSLLENRPPGAIRLAFCWAHCRRRFYEIHQATGSPLAEEALRQIRRALRRSRRRSAAAPPRSGARPGRSAASRSWTPCTPGSPPSSSGSRASPASPRRSATPCATGRGWCCSSRMAGSSSTPTPSSGRSGRSPWAQECLVRRLGWRSPPLGDRGQPGGDREAQRGRALGVAHRRARAHGLGPDQGPRARRGCCPGPGRPTSSAIPDAYA